MSSAFRVTTTRDGSRSFGEHDDRTVTTYGGGRRGRDGGDSWRGGDRGGSRGGDRGGQRGGGGNQYRPRGRGGRYRGKNSYRGGSWRGGGRGGGINPRSRLDDDDIDMDGGAPQAASRYNPYGARPNRVGRNSGYDNDGRAPRGRSNGRGRGRDRHRPYQDKYNWWEIMIPHGKKSTKDFILQSINSLTDSSFTPFHFHYRDQNAMFYVNDKQAAEALRACSRKITMPNGCKMMVVIKNVPQPNVQMTDEVIAKLKIVMSSRYEPATKALNLKNLFADEDLKKEGIQLALSRFQVASNILTIIQENIPELVSLDMSDNRLMSLDVFSSLANKAPNVTKLNLGQNQLKSEFELEKIKHLKLEELCLDGNQLCDRFSDETAYISAIRKRFPKVIKLDGHVLPPPITFDVESTERLPDTQGSFFLNAEAQSLAFRFLEQYYNIYDGGDRQQLLAAYHEQAVFSMYAFICGNVPGKQAKLVDYFQVSRNLKRMTENHRRQKQLKVGKLNIVAMLTELPSTQHDPTSFVVDIQHASASLMVFSVHGLFKETNTKSTTPPIRSFTRTFITVPQGEGIVISNEQFALQNATREQIKNSFKTPAPTPSSSPIPSTSGEPPALPGGAPTPEIQQAMIKQFSTQSGMNAEWSTKCLGENGWNYDKAAAVFTEIHKNGGIPAAAFVK